jgi:hypothetical protein
MPAIMMATSAIGAGISMYSQIQAGQAQAEAGRVNANLARQNAADELNRGAAEAGAIQMRGSQVVGAQRAAMAGNGIDTSVGSAAGLEGSTRTMAELDSMTRLNNAARRAWGYQLEANEQNAMAGLAEQRSILGAVGTGIGTLGDMATLGYMDKSRRVRNVTGAPDYQ